ncbi:MAG: hypothetical protein CMH57_14975 [Myxococcales bacterium]|nr:hypothetical protein [Myxococcales bacterium]
MTRRSFAASVAALSMALWTVGCVGPPTRPDKGYRAECDELEDAYNSANGFIIGGTVGGMVVLPISMVPAIVAAQDTSSELSPRTLVALGLGSTLLVGLPLFITGHALAPSDDTWIALGCGEPEPLPPRAR